MSGRALQVIGVIATVLGAGFFYQVAGGMYGWAEFAMDWQRRLSEQTTAQMGALTTIAGIVVLAVGTVRHADDEKKRREAAKSLGHD